MPRRAMRSVPAFVPEALAACRIGAWETDFDADRTVSDATTAALFGVDPAAAARGAPLDAFADAIHPEDTAGFRGRIGRLRERGGVLAVEYRTRPVAGVVCWVLARGSYARDGGTGHVVGRGSVFDITDSRPGSRAAAGGLVVAAESPDSPVARVAAYALRAREAVDRVDPRGRTDLRLAADSLLWTAGRALAREIDEPEPLGD